MPNCIVFGARTGNPLSVFGGARWYNDDNQGDTVPWESTGGGTHGGSDDLVIRLAFGAKRCSGDAQGDTVPCKDRGGNPMEGQLGWISEGGQHCGMGMNAGGEAFRGTTGPPESGRPVPYPFAVEAA